MVGKQLGQYEILERIGSGGMGEVFRARDTELQRDVAIKVLPHALARDPQRLASFRQEARTLAGIQHANIAAIYGLDRADGVQFFAQELIPGQNLSDRLEEGPLELDDVLSIAVQIAEGLEAAHAAGVVHRDLKPANVMLTPEGQVKLLDFGLATPAIEEDAPAPVADESTPTLSSLQPENVIFGTPAYMSPDQARGRYVDARSDIWSFGCVLYEMLTGDRAFDDQQVEDDDGEGTLLDTLSAVVRSDPDWDAIPESTPARLVMLVRRCLRKKVRERLQHIGDARIEIEELLADPGLGAETSLDPAAPRPGRLPAPPVLLALGLAAAVAGWLVGGWTAGVPTGPPLHASLTIPDGARLVTDTSVSVAISPDRSRVAYVADVDGVSRVHLQSLSRRERTVLSAERETNNPFFSPDGSWIGFFVQNRRLMKMPAGGGAAFEICDVPSGNWGATWLPDDTIVYAPAFTGAGLMRVSAEGGDPEPLLALDPEVGEVGHRHPQALPGGRVLFVSRRIDGAVAAVLDLETKAVREVLPGAVDARWSSTGHLLFSRDGQLFATSFDPNALTVGNSPELLVHDLYVDAESGEARFDLGASDTLVYLPGEATPAADRLVWVDRDGTVERLNVEPGDYGHPRLSPDGTAVAMDRTSDGRGDIWVYDLRRRGLSRVTREGDNRMPIWGPGGQRIGFASNIGASTGIFWKNADGSGERHRLLLSENSLWPRSWRDDALVYYEIHPATGRDIWALVGGDATDSAAEPRPVVASAANERAPALSPDGRWVAYVSDESGRDQVYVQAFGGSPARTTVSIEGGREPVWSPDGTELFYREGRRMIAVPVTTGERFEAGTPEVLFEGAFKADSMGSNQYFDVDPGGGRFLMIERGGGDGPGHLHLIVGFASRLRE